MIRYLVLICVGLVFSASAVLAANEDEGLYDPQPPEGSAFVRFVHADDSQLDVFPILGRKKFALLSYQEVTPYFVKSEGKTQIGFDDVLIEKEVEAGKFYTAVFAGNEVRIFDDYASNNRTKALIQFYNLVGSDTLRLTTADGKIDVVAPTKPLTAGYREVNGARIGFTIYSGDSGSSALASIEEKTLERGAAYSVFAFLKPGQNDVAAEFVKSRTDTTR